MFLRPVKCPERSFTHTMWVWLLFICTCAVFLVPTSWSHHISICEKRLCFIRHLKAEEMWTEFSFCVHLAKTRPNIRRFLCRVTSLLRIIFTLRSRRRGQTLIHHSGNTLTFSHVHTTDHVVRISDMFGATESHNCGWFQGLVWTLRWPCGQMGSSSRPCLLLTCCVLILLLSLYKIHLEEMNS